MTTPWKSCATPPEKDGYYEVERLFKDGGQLWPPEPIKWSGQWEVNKGSDIMPYDRYREIEQVNQE